MKIVLKDEQLYFSAMNERVSTLPVEIPFEDLSQKRKNAIQWKYKVNNGDYRELDNNKFVVKFKDLRKGVIKIVLVGTDRSTRKETTYETEELSVQHYAGFGATIQEAYPRVIKEQNEAIEALKERVKTLEEEGDFV